MTVLVDTNVLLDVLGDDPDWGGWSTRALERSAALETLIVNPIVYAELSAGYERIEDVERIFTLAEFRRESLPWEAAFLAGRAHAAYRRRGGMRHTPLPDLLIGAHALVAGHRLLTRDARRYRTYFPRLDVIAP